MFGAPRVNRTSSRLPQRRGVLRCLGCVALTGIIFMVSMACLCGGTLLLYTASPPSAVNILILGNDARPGSGEDNIARTDTIMIVSIDPANERISILSVPRDLFISSPNYGNIPVNTIVRNAEITAPGSGLSEMTASLERTFGIQIDYHMRISFEGFVELVDAVGGVEIDVPKHIVDNEYPLHDGRTIRVEFQPGLQWMSGETALIYARTRHADDDYQRAGRQQQVLNAVFDKLTKPASVRFWPGVWRAFQNNVDSDLSFGKMLQLIPAIVLYGHSPNQIERLVIDRDNIITDGDVASPDMAKLTPWIQSHLVH